VIILGRKTCSTAAGWTVGGSDVRAQISIIAVVLVTARYVAPARCKMVQAVTWQHVQVFVQNSRGGVKAKQRA